MLARDFAAQLPEDASGLIVNIVDQRVWSPNPRFYSYTLSKSALLTATKTMAQALAPTHPRQCHRPRPDPAERAAEPGGFPERRWSLILKTGPQLGEFGRTIRFLFDTPSITGQMIALDGGQHLAWQTPDMVEIVE